MAEGLNHGKAYGHEFIVPASGSIEVRAEALMRIIEGKLKGGHVNLIG